MGSDSSENEEENEGDGKVLVGVRITPERRDEWKEFVENSGNYSSMAGLMRRSVENTINKKESSGAEEKLDMLADDVDHLIQTITEFRRENRELFKNIDDAEMIAEEVIFLQEELGVEDDMFVTEEIDGGENNDQ